MFKSLFKNILQILSLEDKKELFLILFVSLIVSIIELVAVAGIIPFVHLAGDFSFIGSNEYFLFIYRYLTFNSEISFVLFIGFLLLLFYLFRAFINYIFIYFLSNFAQSKYKYFSDMLFRKYINLNYQDYINHNTSNLVKNIVNEASNISLFIYNFLFLISEFFLIILIYGVLLFINWKVTLIISIFLTINILIIIFVISKKVKKAGNNRDFYQRLFFKLLGSSFGNFKILKLRLNEVDVMSEFNKYTEQYIKSNILHSIYSQIPRLYLETVAFVLLILLVLGFIYIEGRDISSILGEISFFMLALFRLIPSLNRILSSYSNMLFYSKSVDVIFKDLSLNEEKCGLNEISYSKMISLKNISFYYNNTSTNIVLDKINLDIKKGSKIAFIGESGSGKSTLVDIIIGLIIPTSGAVYIDSQKLEWDNVNSWRNRIGYIPQHIYLFDGTIAENIALSDKFDRSKVVEVLKQAQIYDFLVDKHKGIYTEVGDNGLKLSGGQKQRIAIARALYTNPDVLVLDEATSALDDKTENNIMNEIYRISKDKTLFVIAHRLTTIKKCDFIYKIENGKLEEVNYNEIISHS